MNDWPVKTLGDLMTVQNGYAFDSQYFSPSGKIGLIRIRDLKGGVGTETQFVGSYDEEYVVTAGDYLIGMDGEFRCYEWKGDPALLNQRVCRLRNFGNSLDARFLFHGINKFLKEIEDVTGYTTVKHLSSKSILAIEMPVPPLEEQKRIVALLDNATARVTELTVCYEQARTHANNLFASAMRDALESNPDWPVRTLGDLCDIYQPQTISTKDLIADGKYIVYGANGPIGRYDRFNHEKSEVTVTCRGATCGTVNVTPPEVWITGNAMVVRPNDMEMSKEMMRFVLEGLDYSRIITGAAQPQITRQTLAPLTIQVPPLDEQKRIVARLDLMRAKTSEMVAAYDAKLTAAKNLRQSILESAFAGDL